MKVVSISNFRSNLKKHLDEVIENSENIMIPRNNNEEDAIVIMSIGEYNSMKETEYLLQSEVNRKRLQKSLLQAHQGKTKQMNVDDLVK